MFGCATIRALITSAAEHLVLIDTRDGSPIQIAFGAPILPPGGAVTNDVDPAQRGLRIVFDTLQRQLLSSFSVQQVDAHMSALFGDTELQRTVQAWAEDKNIRRCVKNTVREFARPLFDVSRLLNHAVMKPQGYSGDFEILEHIYDETPFASSTGPGIALDQWALGTTLPLAVRSRKNILKALLQAQIESGATRILSVASGAAREIRELECLPANVRVDLVDSDPASFQRLENLASPHMLSRIDRYVGDAITMKVVPSSAYDIIYSFGLFDYLSDKLIDRCIRNFLPSLHENGTVIFSLKDVRFYQAWFYDCFLDWSFVPRRETDGFIIAQRNGLRVEQVRRTENRAVSVYICSRA